MTVISDPLAVWKTQVVQFNPDFVISSLNVHRLLITAIMLASKFFDDVYYNNAYYARVGGISNSEVNSLEMEMLRMISFSLFVQPDQYERYRGSLYSHVSSPTQPGLPAGTGFVQQQSPPGHPGPSKPAADAHAADHGARVADAALVVEAAHQQAARQQHSAAAISGGSCCGGGSSSGVPFAPHATTCAGGFPFATGFPCAGGGNMSSAHIAGAGNVVGGETLFNQQQAAATLFAVASGPGPSGSSHSSPVPAQPYDPVAAAALPGGPGGMNSAAAGRGHTAPMAIPMGAAARGDDDPMID